MESTMFWTSTGSFRIIVVLEMGCMNVPGQCKSKHIKLKVFKGSSFPSTMDEGFHAYVRLMMPCVCEDGL